MVTYNQKKAISKAIKQPGIDVEESGSIYKVRMWIASEFASNQGEILKLFQNMNLFMYGFEWEENEYFEFKIDK